MSSEVNVRYPAICSVRPSLDHTVPLKPQKRLGDGRCVNAESLRQLRLRHALVDREPVHQLILADVHPDLVQTRGDPVSMSSADSREQEADPLFNGPPDPLPNSMVNQLFQPGMLPTPKSSEVNDQPGV